MKTIKDLLEEEKTEDKEEKDPINNDVSHTIQGDNKTDNIVYLPIEMLEPYPDHLFRPYSEEKLHELADDIAENGIISPVCVRPIENRYQILAGHNRTAAAKLAGLADIPCTVKDYNDDTAALVVVNSNLNQRENLLPSEKARAYKIQMDYFNKRGKNVEILGRYSDNEAENQEHCQFGKNESSERSAYRFIRLTYLIDELLHAVDNDRLAIVAGEELSYIDRNEQGCIYQYFFSNNQGILDIKTAKLLRLRSKATTLTYDEIERLLKKDKKPGVIKAYKIPTKKIQQYIPPGTPPKDAEDTIIKALKFYIENYEKINQS